MRATRTTLTGWNPRPLAVVGPWIVGSLLAASTLLLAVWAIAAIASPGGRVSLHQPPLDVGDLNDVARIVARNALVLALHAMACVAGFIAGSSLPLQASYHTGVMRVIHERAGRLAIAFVIAATTFSLSAQAWVLGMTVAHVASGLHTSPGLLLLGLLPHALPELTALFLPLAAWIIASRRGDWDQLLAATLVTVGLAVPTLVLTALWEVYGAPHLLTTLIGYQ